MRSRTVEIDATNLLALTRQGQRGFQFTDLSSQPLGCCFMSCQMLPDLIDLSFLYCDQRPQPLELVILGEQMPTQLLELYFLFGNDRAQSVEFRILRRQVPLEGFELETLRIHLVLNCRELAAKRVGRFGRGLDRLLEFLDAAMADLKCHPDRIGVVSNQLTRLTHE